jgi:hypothetical protein
MSVEVKDKKTSTLVAAATLSTDALAQSQQAAPAAAPAASNGGKPNILFIMGDDIGWFNISAYNMGIMGYRTPNIDRIGREGAVFTDWYGQQSCTAGRAAFVTGQTPVRTGLTKVGLPGAELGLGPLDPSVADVLKTYGYATGQFGKNHLGDRDEHLPTAHGFDEFFGNLYHLNAEEEPENPDYPKDRSFANASDLAACCTPMPMAGSRTRVRSPPNAWKRSMRNFLTLRRISSAGSTGPTSHGSVISIRHGCMSSRI